MARKILQAGPTAGKSAVSGIHSSKPEPLPANYDGLKHVLPDDFTPQPDTRYTLRGKDGRDVQVPLIGWASWSWGDVSTFHWSDDKLPSLQNAWQACLKRRLTFMDTAQVYGSGSSGRILGDLINNHSLGTDRAQIIVQTKWLLNVTDAATNIIHPVDDPVKQLRNTVERTNLEHVSHERSASRARRPSRDQPVRVLDSATHAEIEGMLETCKQHDIVFQSYSALAQGRLSGKYSEENQPPKEYRFSSYDMEHMKPALEVLRCLAAKDNVSVAAVAMNWNVCKGAIPVVGIRKESQAIDNMQALGWILTREEIAELDSTGFKGKTTKLWQQG